MARVTDKIQSAVKERKGPVQSPQVSSSSPVPVTALGIRQEARCAVLGGRRARCRLWGGELPVRFAAVPVGEVGASSRLLSTTMTGAVGLARAVWLM